MAGIALVALETTKRLLDARMILDLIEESYELQARGKAQYTTPPVMSFTSDTSDVAYRFKGCVIDDDDPVAGFRVAAGVAGGHGPGTRLLLLVSSADGTPIALVDEHWLYVMRTAASALVPLKYLLGGERGDTSLALIGTGRVARAALELLGDALPGVESVQVVGESERDAAELVERWRGRRDGLEVSSCSDPVAAVRNSAIVVSCTSTRTPIFSAGDVGPGGIVCTVGYFEVAPDTYREFEVHVVDDWNVSVHAPDMRGMIEHGQFSAAEVDAECADVIASGIQVRTNAHDRILVRCDGLTVQDVVLSRAAYRLAVAGGGSVVWDPAAE